MRRNGIPQDVALALRALTPRSAAWGAAATVTRPLADGSELRFADRTWRVHHRPGHSPSDTVFHDEASGELIGGDHLISPDLVQPAHLAAAGRAGRRRRTARRRS